MEKIIIKDAFENNLKHLDLKIPLDKFTCVTGCSGCGKSSLVFDTIYAESQRAFLEGMTGNIYGQKLMNKPKVGSIENLRPALHRKARNKKYLEALCEHYGIDIDKKKSPNSAITSFASCFMLMTKPDANWPIKRANEKSSTM